jgi:tripartite-type tricarboxylate transporter receptor subunit TctC
MIGKETLMPSITRRTALLSGLAAPAIARAQPAWPQRSVRIIVPYAAGGGTDLTTRAVMESVGQRLNRPVVIENQPGIFDAI